MIIRTISQLPKATEVDDKNSLFEISIKHDDMYISKAITYSNLYQSLSRDIDDEIRLNYGITNNINLSSMNTAINALSVGNCTLKGKKDLISCDVLLNTVEYDNTKLLSSEYRAQAASVGYVLDALKNGSTFVGANSKATGFVTTGGMRYQAEQDGLMQFMFNEEAENPRSSTVCNIPQTGNLVLYGWLADNGNVDPAASWIALEVYSDTIMEGGGWIVASLQPWIQGTKHSNLQYVGFNVPVAKGMQLRLTTGFDLNFSNSTYQSRKNSMVINTQSAAATNITNAFIGYVLY